MSSNGTTATLDPTNPLLAGTTYQVTVKGTATDANGNPLGSDATWTFATIAARGSLRVSACRSDRGHAGEQRP